MTRVSQECIESKKLLSEYRVLSRAKSLNSDPMTSFIIRAAFFIISLTFFRPEKVAIKNDFSMRTASIQD